MLIASIHCFIHLIISSLPAIQAHTPHTTLNYGVLASGPPHASTTKCTVIASSLLQRPMMKNVVNANRANDRSTARQTKRRFRGGRMTFVSECGFANSSFESPPRESDEVYRLMSELYTCAVLSTVLPAVAETKARCGHAEGSTSRHASEEYQQCTLRHLPSPRPPLQMSTYRRSGSRHH